MSDDDNEQAIVAPTPAPALPASANRMGRPLVPETVEQCWRLAEGLAKSQIIPRALQGHPSDVMVVLLTGLEFGLAPMQALRSINVIDGKPVMSAALIVGLVKRAPVCRYFRLVSSNAESATYETFREGDDGPTSMTFTIDEAKSAGLLGKNNWKSYPAAMLRARCSSALAQAVYQDLIANVYDPDELSAGPAEPSEARPAAKPRRRQSRGFVAADPPKPADPSALDEPDWMGGKAPAEGAPGEGPA